MYDSASAYNTSNGIFTVPSGQGGKYYFTTATRLTNWNLSQHQIFLKDNGGDSYLMFEDGDADGDNNTVHTSGIVSLAAGASIHVVYYQNGGTNAQPRTGQNNTFFSGFKLIGV